MAAQLHSYTYSDLTPMLDEAKKNTAAMADINTSINGEYKKIPHMYEEYRTVGDAGTIRDRFKINSANNKVDNLIAQNQDIYQKYRAETDRRNGIINRMWQIRQNIKDRYGSDTKNRLASINMIKRDIKEYKKLREEANTFSKNIIR